MSKTVIALFDHLGQAQDAAELLRARGLVPRRLHVLTGEEFVQRGQLPPPEHERALWSGAQTFFEEIGLMPPGPRPEDAYQPIEPNDGVVLLETSDETAEAAAAMLEAQEDVVDIDARAAEKADPDSKTIASNLEPATSGRTPPDLARGIGETAGRTHRRVRIYDTTAPGTARH